MRLGASRRGPLLSQKLEALRSEGLTPTPRTRIADNLFHAIVDSDCAGVGLDDESPADIAVGNAITVPIEGDPEILMDQRFRRVAVIVRNARQRTQRFRFKTVQRAFAGLAMQASIGDFAQPLAYLSIHIVQIGELAQRPEVLSQISDGALDFPFFPSAGRIAGVRKEIIFAGEAEEAWVKADDPAVMFGDSCGQIVISDLARDAAQLSERMNMTTGEGFKALAMSELDIHHSAVRIDQSESIELARIARVSECAEVSPVNFEAFPGHRLHAHEGAAGKRLRTHLADIFLEDARAAGITERAQALFDDGGCDQRILLQPCGDIALE